MATTLPDGIAVFSTSRGTEWHLPVKNSQNNSIGGFIVILFFTLFWCGVTGSIGYGFLRSVFNEVHSWWSIVMALLSTLFLTPFILVGLVSIFITLFYFASQSTTIIIDEQWIHVTNKTGFFRWTQRRKKASIRNIKVDVTSKIKIKPRKSGHRLRESSALKNSTREGVIVSADGARRNMIIAGGYDRDILIPLAHALAEKCSTDVASILSADVKDHAPKVEIVPPSKNIEPIATDTRHETTVEKPASSNAILVDDGRNVTIVLPPMGLLKNAGLLIFSAIWLGITNAIFVAILLDYLNGGQNKNNSLVGLLFISVFELIGIGILMVAIHSGRRKAVLIANQTELLFSQVSPIRKSEKRWDAADIKEITWGASGVEVNEIPQMQLQIMTSNNKKHGLLTGRNEDELKWLAQELKKVIKK